MGTGDIRDVGAGCPVLLSQRFSDFAPFRFLLFVIGYTAPENLGPPVENGGTAGRVIVCPLRTQFARCRAAIVRR